MHFLSTRERVYLVILITGLLLLIAYAVYNRVTYKQEITKKTHVIDTISEPKKTPANSIVKTSYVNTDGSILTWNKIGRKIVENHTLYDLIIVVMNPELMPYVSSAISFMIENLNKPVIFTTKFSDSLYRLLQTISIPEVMIAQNGVLLRASRITPNIASVNYPPLNEQNCLALPSKKSQVKLKYVDPNINIAVIYIYPNMTPINVSPKEVHGIILVCWNNGKISSKILKQLSELTNAGVVIVAVFDQAIVPNINQIDPRLLDSGVIYGYDMTIPAAYSKLRFLLTHVPDRKLIGKMIETNLRGEISV